MLNPHCLLCLVFIIFQHPEDREIKLCVSSDPTLAISLQFSPHHNATSSWSGRHLQSRWAPTKPQKKDNRWLFKQHFHRCSKDTGQNSNDSASSCLKTTVSDSHLVLSSYLFPPHLTARLSNALMYNCAQETMICMQWMYICILNSTPQWIRDKAAASEMRWQWSLD